MNTAIRKKFRLLSSYFLKLITNLSYLFSYNNKKIPILVYHRIYPQLNKKGISYLNVYPKDFDKQMNYLRKNYEVIRVSEYIERTKNHCIKGNEVCVTFDDGFKDNYIYAYPILKKYGLRASFFLTTKYIGCNTIFPWIQLDNCTKENIRNCRNTWLPLSWQEVKEMMQDGMEFGTHTHTHENSLSRMKFERAREEIEESTNLFKKMTGIYPEIFSYPHGTFKDYNDIHIELLTLFKYKAALTTNIGRNKRTQNLYELKRLIIYEDDSLWEFKKKVRGAYDIAGNLQKLWLNIAGAKSYSSQ